MTNAEMEKQEAEMEAARASHPRDLQEGALAQAPTPMPPGPTAAPEVLGTYEDGKPAIKTAASGKGTYIHFAWLPGISYSCGA